MSASTSAARKRLRFTPVALVTGLLASGLLALSMTGTLSGFIASITNSTNTAGSGSLVMQETTGSAATSDLVTCLSTDGGTVSSNTATCTTINKFGGILNMAPGNSSVINIKITNKGTITPASFVLSHGSSCVGVPQGEYSGSGTETMCAQLKVTIVSGAVPVFTGTAASLADSSSTITMPAAPAAGVSIPFTITTTFDPPAGAGGNIFQGLSVSFPLTWTFTA